MPSVDDVRDPHKWRKFIGLMANRAASLASNNRSLLGLWMDLDVPNDALPGLRRLEGAIYKLARLARNEEAELSRKEIVVMYNAMIHGPGALRAEAFKMLERVDG